MLVWPFQFDLNILQFGWFLFIFFLCSHWLVCSAILWYFHPVIIVPKHIIWNCAHLTRLKRVGFYILYTVLCTVQYTNNFNTCTPHTVDGSTQMWTMCSTWIFFLRYERIIPVDKRCPVQQHGVSFFSCSLCIHSMRLLTFSWEFFFLVDFEVTKNRNVLNLGKFWFISLVSCRAKCVFKTLRKNIKMTKKNGIAHTRIPQILI